MWPFEAAHLVLTFHQPFLAFFFFFFLKNQNPSVWLPAQCVASQKRWISKVITYFPLSQETSPLCFLHVYLCSITLNLQKGPVKPIPRIPGELPPLMLPSSTNTSSSSSSSSPLSPFFLYPIVSNLLEFHSSSSSSSSSSRKRRRD